MKILAKQRLTARQVPAELFQLNNNIRKSLVDELKYIGIDLNKAKYRQEPSDMAMHILYFPEDYKNSVLLVFFKNSTRIEYYISYYSQIKGKIEICSTENKYFKRHQIVAAYTFNINAQVALDLRNKRNARALNNEKDLQTAQLIKGHAAVNSITKEIIQFISSFIADTYKSLLPIQRNKVIVDNITKRIDYIVSSAINSAILSACKKLRINGKYDFNYLYYLSSIDVNNKGHEYQSDHAAIMQFSNIQPQEFMKEFKYNTRVFTDML